MSAPLDLRDVEARRESQQAVVDAYRTATKQRGLSHAEINALDAAQEYVEDVTALLTALRAVRKELTFRAGPISGDLALIQAAANDALVCEPTLGIANMRRQLEAIRETGRIGTEHAAAMLASVTDGVGGTAP